jgi:hypothetical protein
MQTSKIQIGGIYALKVRGKQVRFTVTAIRTTTLRTSRKASPTDTVNRIIGTISEGDAEPNAAKEERTLEVAPEHLDGTYDEFEALKARQEEDERAAKEKLARMEAERQQLQDLLYEITGLVPQEKPNKFATLKPIEVSYRGVEFGQETLLVLLNALRTLKNK